MASGIGHIDLSTEAAEREILSQPMPGSAQGFAVHTYMHALAKSGVLAPTALSCAQVLCCMMIQVDRAATKGPLTRREI